jgi:hypothetical protein
MAYNTRNKLLRAKMVQDIWADNSKNNIGGSGGCTDEWIYKNIIWPQLKISRSTFYAYLLISVEKELKRLEETQKKQLTLFG